MEGCTIGHRLNCALDSLVRRTYSALVEQADFEEKEAFGWGHIQSLDWTGGLDWWTTFKVCRKYYDVMICDLSAF